MTKLCLWSVIAKQHGLQGCVNNRACTGKHPKEHTPGCESFIEFKDYMERHLDDIKKHHCVWNFSSTDPKDERRVTIPDTCREKGCNGINKKCLDFANHEEIMKIG